MLVIIGIIIVFGSILGGFLLINGPLLTLVQPSEFIVIGGACLGTVVLGAPLKIIMQVVKRFPVILKGSPYNKDVFTELLKLQYEVYINVKKGSWLSLEADVSDPEKSPIFTKYPNFLANHHARDFFCDAMMMMINRAAQIDEIESAMDVELETHEVENAIVPGILNKASDSLPGLGIVAAVLGIVVTMQHIDGPPEEIGHHVAAALVGTFLGLLLSYGLLSPLSSNLEKIGVDEGKYLECIKAGLIAFANGAAPVTAVEFARKALFSFDRPGGVELDKQLKEVRPR